MVDAIGPYRLLGVIGEGGFGVVYEAEQAEPVRRRVALKVIKPGMDSKAVVTRFEAERQALALMDHPCVAKVFDAGTTPPGQGARPYFAMELVRGEAITDFCDKQRLTIDERLELFIRVCEAVQHAHMKGVIHRDLKPSNILVEYKDGRAEPKVIDFGVAKALNQRLTEQTVFTERGQLIGTPEYMSPEQAEMSGLDIDTRSDVYSLGVILYELLTGARPFDPETLRKAGYAEIQRIIREVEPPKPSTRLQTMLSTPGDPSTASKVIESRRTEPRTLTGVLKRDLDWVVMKCLEKDRGRRYDTPHALATEIQRYLDDEPVLAGPPSVGYRLGKFVKRNRTGVVAGGLVAVALLAAIGALFWGQMVAHREAERSRVSEAKRAAVAGFFLEDVLGGIDPDISQGRDITISELVELAANKTGRMDDPEVRAAVESEIGALYYKLSRLDDSLSFLERARATRGEVVEEPDAGLAEIDVLLAKTLYEMDDVERAEHAAERAVDVSRSELGDDLRTAYAIQVLSSVKARAGDQVAAQELIAEAIMMYERVLGDRPHPEFAAAIGSRAHLMSEGGDNAAAVSEMKRAVSMMREIDGAASERAANLIGWLGVFHRKAGDLDLAFEAQQEAIEIRKRILPEGDTRVAQSLTQLGTQYLVSGRHAEAEGVFREALAMYEAKPEEDPLYAAIVRLSVAQAVARIAATDDSRFQEACAALEASADEFERLGQPLRRVNAQLNLGKLLSIHGDERAGAILDDCLAQAKASGDVRYIQAVEKAIEEHRAR